MGAVGMGAVGVLLGLMLLVFELALVARMVLDWVGVLTPGGGRWSSPARRMAHTVTEPVLAPVRRVLPPVRLGSVSIDLAFTVVFVLVLVLRTIVAGL
jgi:YggT family protein